MITLIAVPGRRQSAAPLWPSGSASQG